MNYPTSDLQFVAQMVKKVREGDQVTVSDEERLAMIALKGHSSMASASMTGQSTGIEGQALEEKERAERGTGEGSDA
jgi:hypothetical protein